MRLLFAGAVSPVAVQEAGVKGSFISHAAALSPPLPGLQVDNNLPRSFRPSIAVIIAVLVTMFSLTFLLLLYAKHCKQNAMAVGAREDAGSNHAARPRASGVDRAIVESLPFFKFSCLKGMKEGLECSVCLNAFEESEMLRLLPKCKHAFHVECVDKWLESHSTCPLCRHKVEPDDVLLAEDITCRKPLGSSANSTDFHFQEEGAVEFFVQREIEADGERSFRSSRFNIDRIGSARQEVMNRSASFLQETVGIGCLDKLSRSGRKEGLLLAEAEIVDCDRFLQRFAHRIIVSDVIFQHRWSDFKTSDLDFLNRTGSRRLSLAYGSGNLQVPDSKPYSSHGFEFALRPPGEGSGSGGGGAESEKISKLKKEMERKRRLDKQASRLKNSSNPTPNNIHIRGRFPLTSPGRSMSEITSLQRFPTGHETSISKRDEEKIKRWISIARTTLRWFALGGRKPSGIDNATEVSGIEDKSNDQLECSSNIK